jgi:hypothetical protein
MLPFIVTGLVTIQEISEEDDLRDTEQLFGEISPS